MALNISPAPQHRVYLAFFIYSLALGGIYTRLGDMQLSMGIKQGALGAGLMGAALGTQISLMFAGITLKHISHRNGLILFIPFLALVDALASLSPNPVILFFILSVAGLAIGTLEVIINLEADRVEHQIGKRIMNRSHGFWSLGFFAAGIVGAFAKQLHISPFFHLLSVAVGIVLLTLWTFKDFVPAPERNLTKEAAPLIVRPTKGILILVAFTLSAMLLEGAGIDWSVIYMRDVFAASPFVATLAFSFGALCQALLRFVADGFVDKYGPIRVAKFMILLLGAGTLIVTLSPNIPMALLGFSLVGAGASTLFPLAMSAAAQRTDRPAASNVAALAQISFITFLVAPPLLGYVAEHFGIRVSFGVGLPLVILSWFTLFAIAPAKNTDNSENNHGSRSSQNS